MSEYKIERLTTDNFKDLQVIYLSAFGYIPDMNELRAKFNTSSFSENNVGYIAYSKKNEPAAFYGVFPYYININGQKTLVAQSGDTMTHADHRRKGLFVQLAEKTYELCRSLGIQVVFGFPNYNSYPGFVKKLNWKHENDIKCYTLNSRNRIKRKLKSTNTFKPTVFKELIKKSRTKQANPFKSITDPSNLNIVERTQEFLEYKKYFPKEFLKINEKTVIVKVEEPYLLIGDIENSSKKEFEDIIKVLLKIARKSGLDQLRINTNHRSNLESMIIDKWDKMEVEYPIGYVSLGKIEKFSINLSFLDYDTF